MDEFRRRIEASISTATDPVEAAELRAHRTFAQIRHGEFQSAEQGLIQMREQFGNGHYPRISILIFIAEGLVLYFRDLSKKSIDRIYLASALSKSLCVKDLEALANSWLAHLYYNFDQYERLATSISDTIKLTENARADWIPRVALVIADTLQLAGEWAEADSWYHLAHRHSTMQGDRLTLGSVIFNRLAVGISRVRADRALQTGVRSEVRWWITEANSAQHFHLGLSMLALPDLLGFCSARAEFFEGNYERAKTLYSEILANGSAQHCGVNGDFILSEIALCRVLQHELSPPELTDIGLSIEACDGLALDDKMVYHANLLELWRAIDSANIPTSLLESAASSKQAYELSRRSLNDQVATLKPLLVSFSRLLNSK